MREDAYILSLACKARITQIVDRLHTEAAKLDETYSLG